MPLLAIGLLACSSKEMKNEISSDAIFAPAKSEITDGLKDKAGSAAIAEEKEANISGSDLTVIKKEIIRKAQIHFQVEDLQKNGDSIDKIIFNHHALVSESEATSSSYTKNNRYTIRVPKNEFESLIKALCTQANFLNQKSISSEDVTEEYVDIEARLKNKKEVENRLIEILRNKAKNVEEVLATENQLRVIREEIESREARLNYLKDQVQYCTINLEFYQTLVVGEIPEQNTYNYGVQIKNAFAGGWNILKYFLLALIYPWPLYILGYLVYRIIRYKIQQKKTTQKVI